MLSLYQFHRFQEIPIWTGACFFAMNSKITPIDTKESNVADDNKLMRMQRRKINASMSRAHAAGGLVDGRARVSHPPAKYTYSFALWNSTHWAKGQNQENTTDCAYTHTHTHTKCVCVCTCIMRKVYLKRKKLITIILCFIIKSNFVPTPPHRWFHENFLCHVYILLDVQNFSHKTYFNFHCIGCVLFFSFVCFGGGGGGDDGEETFSRWRENLDRMQKHTHDPCEN